MARAEKIKSKDKGDLYLESLDLPLGQLELF